MRATVGRFQEAYASAFAEYLADRGELALRAAYELGREAVQEHLSVLELAAIHHAVLESSLSGPTGAEEITRIAGAATEFFQESLSAFEMVQRGFWEATEVARLERLHAARLRQLADASLAIGSTLSLQGILQVLADRARSLTGATCGVARVQWQDPRTPAVEAVSCSEGEGRWRELAAGVATARPGWPGGMPGRTARVARRELESDPAWRASFADLPAPVNGLLATALMGREDRPLGHVLLFDKSDGGFSDRDEAILEQLAQMASIAIENAELYEAERRVAQTLQRRLLPERIPATPGVSVAARYLPGDVGVNVGGDWYDVILLPGDRIGVAVGDVQGRGAHAASVMGQVRMAFRAYAAGEDAPENVADRMDRLIQAMELGHFSTMIYALIDPKLGEIRAVRAGHPPPLLLTPQGEARFLEAGLGVPLGVVAGDKYRPVAQRVDPGSTLILYTDGLVEFQEGLDEGMARLRDAARGQQVGVDELCDRILGHLVGPATHDDVALLAIRLEGPGT